MTFSRRHRLSLMVMVGGAIVCSANLELGYILASSLGVQIVPTLSSNAPFLTPNIILIQSQRPTPQRLHQVYKKTMKAEVAALYNVSMANRRFDSLAGEVSITEPSPAIAADALQPSPEVHTILTALEPPITESDTIDVVCTASPCGLPSLSRLVWQSAALPSKTFVQSLPNAETFLWFIAIALLSTPLELLYMAYLKRL